MEIKGYHILSLEAKYIYEQELINGVEKGYVLPKKNDRAYFGLFKNVLDYSLDLIELEKCYQKKYRNNRFFFEDEYNNKYTLTIINLKFTYTEIRNKAFALGLNVNGAIPYRVRRQIVAQLTFKTNGTTLDIGESIEEKFKKISTRNASFQEMALDEKLQEIANLIENMLKENGKFIALDYASFAFEYLSDETIKNYRKQMQCFRHSSEESVAERSSYTDAQKNFFVDFGIVIVKTIHELKSRL